MQTVLQTKLYKYNKPNKFNKFKRNVKTRSTTEQPSWFLAELTYRCPLQCAYCSNPTEIADYQNEISTDQWKQAITEARDLGCIQIGFSGGEPLMRPDLEELVLTANGLGYYTNLITSGIGLTETRLAKLKLNGLDSIQISFQSDQQDLNDHLAGNDVYHKKIETTTLIKKYDFPLTFNIVIHSQNIDNIKEILDFAFTFDPDFIELANSQYSGGFAFANRDYLLPTLDQVTRAKEIVESYPKGRCGVIYVFPDYYQGRPKACMGGWGNNYIIVTADGSVLPCLSARTLPIDIPRVEQNLKEIWNNSKMFNAFRGTDWMQDPCRTCPERFTDYGGCRCQAYLLTGDKFATDPVCSLSPQHNIITDFVKKPRSEEFLFRNFKNSKKIISDFNRDERF